MAAPLDGDGLGTSTRRSRSSPEASDLFESKLRPPPHAPAIVPRTAILERLEATPDVPIVSVVAPPGYGKTTLLLEWARHAPTRVAWLSLDRHDNDLGVLLSYMIAALARVESTDLVVRGAAPRSVMAATSRIVGALSHMSKPTILVLDHLEVLEDPGCLDLVAELALHLPAGARLALASRRELPLPIPRLRANGHVLEIGVDDLTMTDVEARRLLADAGAPVSGNDAERVIERTEGWPVGLYLAALALKAGGPHERAGISFSGDDGVMAAYLRAEVLSGLAPDDVTFLTRTALLDRLTGDLCDAVLAISGSDHRLQSLSHSNLLVVPVDRRGGWYRYHQLFRDLLRAELHREESDLVPDLHRRAADWFEENGLPETALDHAVAVADADRINRLLLSDGGDAYGLGRGASVRRWLLWFDEHHLLGRYPAVATLGAIFFSAVGDADETERWASAAEHLDPGLVDGELSARRSPGRPLPDGSTFAGWQAVMRLLLSRDGVDRMRHDAQVAHDGLAPSSGFRGATFFFEAMSHLLEDDLEAADPLLARAAICGRKANRPTTATAAIAERGFIACERGHWSDAEGFASEALAMVESAGIDGYSESGLPIVLAARTAVHSGNRDVAAELALRATLIRPTLTHSRPVISLRTLFELARLHVALQDVSGARAVLRQARDIVIQRPSLGTLPARVDQLRSRLETTPLGARSASSLTTAELRLLPFLPLYLSFPQIGERLSISRHTVKTQAISIYQKLGVSSRHEAIERLQEIGLLDS